MDLNSWKPDDNTRRFATLVATAAGVFAFAALWLGLGWNVVLALVAGVGAGALSWPLLHAAFRSLFGR